MRSRFARLPLLALLLASGACRRAEEGVFVTAPFNDATRLGRVEAHWTPTAGGLHFEVRVENRLTDRLFVRLGDFALLDRELRPLVRSTETRACVLGPEATGVVLSGDVALAEADAARVATFDVTRFAVPLSERGRGIYREFVLQQRVRTPAAVDEEIAAYAAAPPCG